MKPMKKYIQFLSLISIGFSLAACKPVPLDENKGPEGGQIIQADKLISMEDSLNSIARIESVVSILASDRASISDDIVTDMKLKLEAAKCLINYKKIDSHQKTGEALLEISGVGCPILAKYTVSLKSAAGDSINYTLSAYFKIADSVLKARNDLSEMTLTGQGKTSIQENKLVSHLKITGNLTSVTKGIIQLSASQDESKSALDPSFTANGTTRYQFAFPALKTVVDGKEVIKPSYTVEIKKLNSIVSGKDTSTYTIGNRPMNQAAYENYINALGILAFPN